MWKISPRLFFFFSLLIPFFLNAQEETNLERVFRVLDGIPREKISIEERSLLADYGGFESSLFVASEISGNENIAPPRGTFVLAVPLEARFAVDTALALVEKIDETNERGVNVLVAFLSGEKNELPEDMGGVSHKGLRDLLTLPDLPENRVICYFDADTPPDELVLSHGIRGYVAPLEIIKPFPPLFASSNIRWSFENSYNSFYKLGLVEGREALSIIREDDINGFVLSGNNSKKLERSEPENEISPNGLSDILLEYAGTLRFPIVNPDKNYTVFTAPGKKIFFASEWIMALLLLVTIGVFLLCYLVYSVRHNVILIFYLRRFIKLFWIFVLLFLWMIISIKLSGFLYSTLAAILKRPESGGYAGLVLALLLSILLFLPLSRILEKIPFLLRERLFGFSSVLFIVSGMLLAALIDISVTPIFIWVFLLVFLGSFVSNVKVIFICALAVPVSVVFALSYIFRIGGNSGDTDTGIAGLFLSSAWNTPGAWPVIFLITALILPSFLFFMRGIVLRKINNPAARSGVLNPSQTIKSRRDTKTLFARKTNVSFFLAAMIATVILAMAVQIMLPKQRVSGERRYVSEVSESDGILAFSLGDIVFQDSRIITVTLSAKGSPKRFDVSIISGTEKILPPVYASPVPFEREDEGKKISFTLGENPPNPLTLEIVLPLEFDGVINAAAVYNKWDPSVDRSEKPDSENYILEVSKSMAVNTPNVLVTSGIPR